MCKTDVTQVAAPAASAQQSMMVQAFYFTANVLAQFCPVRKRGTVKALQSAEIASSSTAERSGFDRTAFPKPSGSLQCGSLGVDAGLCIPELPDVPLDHRCVEKIDELEENERREVIQKFFAQNACLEIRNPSSWLFSHAKKRLAARARADGAHGLSSGARPSQTPAGAPQDAPARRPSQTSVGAPQDAPARRPAFVRPTRASRLRQAQSHTVEFCTLEFDGVDASQQVGLTCRMLAAVKALDDTLMFWDGESKLLEQAYRLLDFEEEDMRVMRVTAQEAASLVGRQRYHLAYNRLCTLRPWFNESGLAVCSGSRVALRAAAEEWVVHAEAGLDAEDKESTSTMSTASTDGADGTPEVTIKQPEPTPAIEQPADSAAARTPARAGDRGRDAAPDSQYRMGEVSAARRCPAPAKTKAAYIADADAADARPAPGRPARTTSYPGASDNPSQSCRKVAPSAADRRSQHHTLERAVTAPVPPASSGDTGRCRAPGYEAPLVRGKGQRGNAAGAAGDKFLVRYKVGIKQEKHFQVMGRLIGPSGANMRKIFENSGAKIRIRGQGSNYLEGPQQVESSDPLMICISASCTKSMEQAAQLVEVLLERIHAEHREFCKARKMASPDFVVRRESPKM